MRVALLSAEVFPYAKTGGLGDVCGSLPLALEKLGVKTTIFLPRYRHIDPVKFHLKRLNNHVWNTTLGKDIQVYFIENEKFYDRDGLYGDTAGDYPDNLERFQYYCAKSLETLKQLNVKIDIVHCHDWQAALAAPYLKFAFNKDPFFAGTKSILTIHNLAYQGIFSKERYPKLGLEEKLFSPDGFEFYGQINLLKAGILYADVLTTVSNTYAKDIQTERLGCGLDGVLRGRKDGVVGILNGIDEDVWNPATDDYITSRYSLADISKKSVNKRELQQLSKLPVRGDVPLFGFVGRLSHQKGIDLIFDGMEELLKLDLQFVLKGVGDGKYYPLLQNLMNKYPQKFAMHMAFDEKLAHQIYAGSDIFLMPSVYEPCGLSQMISLKYGTIPLVYHTGGLIDTVQPFEDGGNGFVFKDYTVAQFIKTVKSGVDLYHNKSNFEALMRKAFQCHFSWKDSAQQYRALYEGVAAKETVES
jgi:starch synthase